MKNIKSKHGIVIIILLLLNLSALKTIRAQTTELIYGDIGSDTIYSVCDKMPEFPGGELGLRKYIAQNVQYPMKAREQNITGMVYIKFVITRQGNVEQVMVENGVHPLLDNEGIRVIKSLPRWKPGELDGTKVEVWYTVPINFELTGSSPKRKKKPQKSETTFDKNDWY